VAAALDVLTFDDVMAAQIEMIVSTASAAASIISTRVPQRSVKPPPAAAVGPSTGTADSTPAPATPAPPTPAPAPATPAPPTPAPGRAAIGPAEVCGDLLAAGFRAAADRRLDVFVTAQPYCDLTKTSRQPGRVPANATHDL
jgi:hypothetical protein